MKSFIKIRKSLCTTAVAAIMAVLLLVSTLLPASAAQVNVYTHKNPQLTMAHIYSKNNSEGWLSDGTIAQSNTRYTMRTNSWAFWLAYDCLDFAYEQTPFNTGKGSTLTTEVTLTSWDGSKSADTASAGICIRNSLEADAVGIFLCVREGNIYFMYRKTTGVEVSRGLNIKHNDQYPISLRIIANKSRNNAAGYYKIGNGNWVSIGNVSFASANRVYTGLAAHSVKRQNYSTAVFDNFSVSLDAPEGYVIEEDTDSSSADTSSEAPIVLPEDLPAYGDALLSETFTDGELTSGEESVTNPIWTVRTGTPNIALNEEKTNRYLSFNSLDSELMMTAGNMKWTDYSVSADIYFPSGEIQKFETNQFSLIFRHRSVVIGGSFDYAVTLVNKIVRNELIGQYLQLNYRTNQGTFIPKYITLCEKQLAAADMIAPDITHTLKVDAVDNVFTVYLDGEQQFTYTHAPEQLSVNTGVPQQLNLIGSVGMYVNGLTAHVDNILVRKIYDPLGGDYDNAIAGNFDKPVPDYIAKRYGRQ